MNGAYSANGGFIYAMKLRVWLVVKITEFLGVPVRMSDDLWLKKSEPSSNQSLQSEHAKTPNRNLQLIE
jgi:hypothetical protein